MLICDEYLTQASLDEAFVAMQRLRDSFRIVAGADLSVWPIADICFCIAHVRFEDIGSATY